MASHATQRVGKLIDEHAAIQTFPSMERVLDGMHKIAMADMAAEASVRKHIRELYMRHATLSTGNCCATAGALCLHSAVYAKVSKAAKLS